MLASKWLYVFLLCMVSSILNVNAQVNAAQKTTKPIVLIAKLGPFDGKNISLLADVKKAVKLNVSVTDSATGTKWNLIRFRLSWKQKDVTQDINSGATKNIFTYNSVTILQNATIPVAWQKELEDNLQSGEEILIEEILAQDPQTKKVREVKSFAIKVK